MLTALTLTRRRYSPVTTEHGQITPISGSMVHSEHFNQPRNSQKFIRLKDEGWKMSTPTSTERLYSLDTENIIQ